MITIVATASGITVLGIGAAFWGITFGLIVRVILRVRTGTPGPQPRRAL